MNDDLKTKTVLLCCGPLFVSMAERLARDFAKVYLYVPVAGSFPTMNAGRVGQGLSGVELVDDVFGPHFQDVELFVFCDLYHAALQIQLESMGKRVWGNRNAEELEIYRELCKRKMEEMELPLQPWKIVTGMTALRAHLKATPQQHVKINRWRGVTETFFAESYDSVATKLDEIAHTLGGFKETLDFIVEDDLPDRVELGIDTYSIDGRYPDATLVGIEAKDCGYIGQMVRWNEIPEPLRRWNEAFAPLFAQYGARGSVSNEIRIGADQVPYMVDATVRSPCPPSELWQEMFTNLSEIIWHGAAGELVEPIPIAPWGVEIILKSQFAEKNWQPVNYPEECARQIKLFNCVVVDGQRYVVPQDDEMVEIGAVVGWGDTLEAALAHAQEAGEAVEGHNIKFTLGSAEQVKKEIAALDELGVSPFRFPAVVASPKVATVSGKQVQVKSVAAKKPKRIRAKDSSRPRQVAKPAASAATPKNIALPSGKRVLVKSLGSRKSPKVRARIKK